MSDDDAASGHDDDEEFVGRTYHSSGTLSPVKLSPLEFVGGIVGGLSLALIFEANRRLLDHKLDGWLERRMRQRKRRFDARK